MASELRFENLVSAITDGNTVENSLAEFRNESMQSLHIKSITCSHHFQTAATDERCTAEISKSPVFHSSTNNGVFFAWAQTMGIESSTTGAAIDDGTVAVNDKMRFGKGELTLEPNESLFVNSSKTSGGGGIVRYQVGYTW